MPKHTEPLHGAPVEYEANFLDKISSSDRLGYYYSQFKAREKSHVEADITNFIPRGKVLNVGCGRHGTERELFPRPHYQIVGVDLSEESL